MGVDENYNGLLMIKIHSIDGNSLVNVVLTFSPLQPYGISIELKINNKVQLLLGSLAN
jgi:hypothetical protein